jgi:hypothetical protein
VLPAERGLVPRPPSSLPATAAGACAPATAAGGAARPAARTRDLAKGHRRTPLAALPARSRTLRVVPGALAIKAAEKPEGQVDTGGRTAACLSYRLSRRLRSAKARV